MAEKVNSFDINDWVMVKLTGQCGVVVKIIYPYFYKVNCGDRSFIFNESDLQHWGGVA